MNDTGLTPDEEQRLSSMLTRAADGLEMPSADHLAPTTSTRRRGPWLAAAALIAVAAVGSAWWAVDRDGDEIVDLVDRLDEPLLQQVIANEGLWRLPSPDSGLELLDVVVSDDQTEPGRLIAVDDPRAPTRWIVVLPGRWGPGLADERLGDPLGGAPLTVGAGVSLVSTGVDSPTGSSWFGVSLAEAERGSGDERHLTVAAGGIPDERMFELLTDLVEGFDPPQESWPALAAIDSLELPDELTLRWRNDAASTNHLLVAVEQPDGVRAMFSLTDRDLDPAVASLLERISFEALDFVQPDDPARYRSVPRPDLGPGAFTYGSTGTESLMVFSRDGVSLHVGAVGEEWGPMPEPLSFDRQVELLGQLRTVDAEEVLAEVLGDSVDADQGVTTTTTGGPDG